MRHNSSFPTSWRSTAFRGARIGVLLTFAYALCFAVYAVVRAYLRIEAVVEPQDSWQIAIGTGVTLAFGILIFASILAIVSAIIGAASTLALRWLLIRLNPLHSGRKALVIGLFAGLGCWLIANAILLTLPGSRLTPTYLETYVFWFGLPGLVFVVASGVISQRLNVSDQWTPRQIQRP